MKIAIVVYSLATETFCEALEKKLNELGHHVVVFHTRGDSFGRPYRVKCRWPNLEFDEIDAFKPDAVMLFNGRARFIASASTVLRAKYRTYLFENAWFPQTKFIYLDPRGCGGDSLIAHTDLGSEGNASDEALEENLKELQEIYSPGPRLGSLPENYVLIPLQLEADTSIRNDSYYFKRMADLIQEMKLRLKGIPIVVKAHPRDTSQPRIQGVTWITTESDMNSLAFYANRVVGINSTSLLESLVHMKPVISFGRSVASSSGVYFMSKMSAGWSEIMGFKPDEARVKRFLYNLRRRQIPWSGDVNINEVNTLSDFRLL